MQAGVQDQPLLVSAIVDYAARWHPRQRIHSLDVEGGCSTSTYAELRTAALACAALLQSLHVRQGDVVATLCCNTRRHLEAWYGSMGMGAVCHTLNPRLFEKDLEYIVNHAQDSVLILDATYVDLVRTLRPRLPSVRHFIVATDAAHKPPTDARSPWLCYDELMAQQRPLQGWPQVDERSACGMCYTSGTTGRPKGVTFSHRSNFLHSMKVGVPDASGLSTRTCVMVIVPMYHANAWGFAFAGPMFGCRMVLPGLNLEGPQLQDNLGRFGVTFAVGVPTVFVGLLQHCRQERLPMRPLQRVLIGGAAMPPSMIGDFAHFGVDALHAWGMTELSPIGTHAHLKAGMRDWPQPRQEAQRSKQGWPGVLMDLRIVSDAGAVLPHDGRAFGELQARGGHTISAYHKADGPATDAEGWFSTGDVATIDADGFVQLVDRSKDVIKSGGEWISSIAVENAACAHEQVLEAAVIGLPHPKWTERPLLLVVPRPGQTPTKDAILAHLKGQISKWWLPDDVLLVEELPHTATGKLSKLTLRQQYQNYRFPQARM